ncbi:Thioredoxin superfamily protein [Forsythia ovata]|uniref:Thioredoxin superfamily protein n=1 Tax=Forsythia ovata TaxID=205694 RepID=A0ABD1VP24_9LAMI
MASVANVTVSSTGARLLSLPRTLASSKGCCSFISSSKCYSKLGFNPLQHRSRALPSRKLLIRAARTESKGVSLGFRAPEFELPEPLTGKVWKLEDFESHPALLVMFICNHCPFVKHLKKDIVKLSNFYMKKGLAVVAISSNAATTHPQDGPVFMAEEAKIFNYPFPYLYDESQNVARDFGAVCTPEFFLYRKDGRRPFELVYHGQFDDSRPSNNVPVTGRDLSLAIDSVLSGQPVPSIQKPSVGCSIKWHPKT